MKVDPSTYDPRQASRRFSGEPRGLLTAREVAAMLGVPVSWVYEQSRRGRIPTVTLGRYRRYRWEAIEAWLDRIEVTSVGVEGGFRAT